MPERIIAIGDIHGCFQALRVLLEAIQPQRNDQIVTLGDVVDRGPETRQTIDLLLELEKVCQLTPVLGNHEEMMLAALRGASTAEMWLAEGGRETLESYGFVDRLNVIPQNHLDFLTAGRDYVESAEHFFVHANYLSDCPLSQQDASYLRWTSLDAYTPPAHCSGKIAVVGHTPDWTGEILALPHLKCIDTACYGGGWLTALEVATGQIWQANQKGVLRRR